MSDLEQIFDLFEKRAFQVFIALFVVPIGLIVGMNAIPVVTQAIEGVVLGFNDSANTFMVFLIPVIGLILFAALCFGLYVLTRTGGRGWLR